MQQQWWVFAGWSNGGAKPFSEFGLAEAALRAGIELAQLTELPAGPFSAPALLNSVLSAAGHDPLEMLEIGATVETADLQVAQRMGPSDSRQTRCAVVPGDASSSAGRPQADDQADWKQRFYRESGLRTTEDASKQSTGRASYTVSVYCCGSVGNGKPDPSVFVGTWFCNWSNPRWLKRNPDRQFLPTLTRR